IDGSLVDRLTKTPPAGAGTASVIGNGTDSPSAKETLGSTIPVCTVMFAVVSAIFGSALAWMTAVPALTPVTGTLTGLAPPANGAVRPTVATAVLLELRLTLSPPAGAGPERFSVRLVVPPGATVADVGENAIVAVTCTEPVPGA